MTKPYNPLEKPLTKIPEHKKNIIIDFMGTMVYENPEWQVLKPLTKKDATRIHQQGMVLRPGIEDLFKAYKNNDEKIVIHSDTSIKEIKYMLNGTGKYINGICSGKEFMYDEQFYDENTKIMQPRAIKNLEKTCETYNLKPDETIFIGDTVIDIDSAQKYHMDMIFIPHSELFPDFNFKDIMPNTKLDYLNSLNQTTKQTTPTINQISKTNQNLNQITKQYLK
ncbi:MAG: HAD hydrolase-like protein [Nanoarchaeota archaeon]